MTLLDIIKFFCPIYDKYGAISSTAILKKPTRIKDGVETTAERIDKGVLLLSRPDNFCKEIPGLKNYFYLIERNGWTGMNRGKTSDIKLIENLETLEQTHKDFPKAILLEFANADFVDTDIFRPLDNVTDATTHTEREFTGIQIAAWKRFKRHDLFVRATSLLPQKKFMKFGHFWDQGRDSLDFDGIALKKNTIALSKSLRANIYYPFEEINDNYEMPMDSTSMNIMINRAKMGILTTEKEGINRFKMECLSANIPFLVPEDVGWPTKKHINDKTGVLFEPTPQGLADAIIYVEENYGQFSPREYILKNTGIHIATKKLRESLRELAKRNGLDQSFEDIYWDGRNTGMVWDKNEALAEIRGIIKEVKRD